MFIIIILKGGVAHCEPEFLVPSFDHHSIIKQYCVEQLTPLLVLYVLWILTSSVLRL